ncbi:MAG: toll/interleukin-1 receptor domain-containing protein, partial [Verrucomicrobiota bacterium]|nr:toll/interleukin-1 receptor domain-containing protein [Verrucomicrobiota bacterium]
CLFHAPAEDKAEPDFREAFLTELAATPSGTFDCKGFVFPRVSFVDLTFNTAVDFRAATFTGPVDFRNAQFLSQADFHTAVFRSNANFFNVLFRTNVRFLGTRFAGRAIFNGSKFCGRSTFHGCKFEDFAAFQAGKFNWHLTFQSNEFVQDADFRSAIFYDGVDFWQTIFRRRANFDGARFHGEVRFIETHLEFLKKLRCERANTRGAVLHTAQMWENDLLSHYDFRDTFLLSVNFSGKHFHDCDFTGAVFKSVLTVGWRPDRRTIENTKFIYTEYSVEERVGPTGSKIRVYTPVADSRVPVEGEFGKGEHAGFTIISYLRQPVRFNLALNVPPVLRTAVSNYLQFFGDFVKVTQGVPVELRTRLEGTKLRVEFLAESEQDLAAIREAFEEYRQTAGLDFEQLKLRIKFATHVPPVEQKLFLMNLEAQLNQLRTQLTYTQALLSKSEEYQQLLKRVLDASRSPAGLLEPVVLPPAASVTTTAEETARPLRLVYSYSHKDEGLRDELEAHLAMLKRTGFITPWHDRRIIAGHDLDPEIDHAFATADIVLLLVSADFLNSDYCFDKEVKTAVERHHRREARVIPILLRLCDWKAAPFGGIIGLPKDMRAVTTWKDRDEAWTNVAEGIKSAVTELLRGREDWFNHS